MGNGQPETCNVSQQGLINALQTDVAAIETCNVNPGCRQCRGRSCLRGAGSLVAVVHIRGGRRGASRSGRQPQRLSLPPVPAFLRRSIRRRFSIPTVHLELFSH